jgi:hypothetical protein
MTLTLQNYFTPDNKYLTNSKIGDYLKSPNYFYRKHILHEIEKPTTTAMVMGSAVDFLLAQEGNKPEYRVVERRNLKNPPTDYIEVNQAQYDEIFEVADAVSKTSVFTDIDKTYEKQVILKQDVKIGEHFVGLAGIPDYIKITDDEIIIIDLKTARTTDPRKYYYHSQEFGYYRQQAHYQMLAQKMYPGRKCVSYHLVVDKLKDIYNVVLFKLDQREIERAKSVLSQIVEEIKLRTDYSRPNLTWNDAIKLTNPNISFEDIVDEEEVG